MHKAVKVAYEASLQTTFQAKLKQLPQLWIVLPYAQESCRVHPWLSLKLNWNGLFHTATFCVLPDYEGYLSHIYFTSKMWEMHLTAASDSKSSTEFQNFNPSPKSKWSQEELIWTQASLVLIQAPRSPFWLSAELQEIPPWTWKIIDELQSSPEYFIKLSLSQS